MYILEASYSSFVVRSVPFLYDGDSYSKNFEFDVYDTTGRHLQRLDVSGALYFDGSVSVLTFDAAFLFLPLCFLLWLALRTFRLFRARFLISSPATLMLKMF